MHREGGPSQAICISQLKCSSFLTRFCDMDLILKSQKVLQGTALLVAVADLEQQATGMLQLQVITWCNSMLPH